MLFIKIVVKWGALCSKVHQVELFVTKNFQNYTLASVQNEVFPLQHAFWPLTGNETIPQPFNSTFIVSFKSYFTSSNIMKCSLVHFVFLF